MEHHVERRISSELLLGNTCSSSQFDIYWLAWTMSG